MFESLITAFLCTCSNSSESFWKVWYPERDTASQVQSDQHRLQSNYFGMVLLLTSTKLHLWFTIRVTLLIHIRFVIIYNSKIKFTCTITSKGIPQLSVSFSKVKNLAVIKFSFCCFQCPFLNCQDHLEFCSSTRALVLCKTECCIHFFIQIIREKIEKCWAEGQFLWSSLAMSLQFDEKFGLNSLKILFQVNCRST